MIDETRLRELEEDFGRDDLHEILEVFLAETEAAVLELGGMIADGSQNALRDQLHFLKGCARNVGASRLGDLCESLEATEAHLSPADHAHVQEEFRSVCAYFAAEPLRRCG